MVQFECTQLLSRDKSQMYTVVGTIIRNRGSSIDIICCDLQRRQLPRCREGLAMANIRLSTFTGLATNTNPSLSSKQLRAFHEPHKRKLLILASSSTSPPPFNVDYLNREFGVHGVGFAQLGESCVVKMGTENGSKSTLMLPSGLITSYKPHMSHGGAVEVLHTTVSEGAGGSAVVQGGVSLGFECGICDGDGVVPWSPTAWSLLDVRGSFDKAVQVELICNDSPENVEVKYNVTLQNNFLCSELAMTNRKLSPLQLMATFVSHLTVSTPDATYAIGLQGSNYYRKPPILSEFSIIPPGYKYNQSDSSDIKQSWSQKALHGLLSGWSQDGAKKDRILKEKGVTEEETEVEEADDYFRMTEKMSRIYTSTPRKFTIMDRGRRNSIIVERKGFDEMYVFSPGSTYEWYGKYAYVCIGPSALLEAIVLEPQEQWRGFQCLRNPNS